MHEFDTKTTVKDFQNDRVACKGSFRSPHGVEATLWGAQVSISLALPRRLQPCLGGTLVQRETRTNLETRAVVSAILLTMKGRFPSRFSKN
jgi:hypothetical protein